MIYLVQKLSGGTIVSFKDNILYLLLAIKSDTQYKCYPSRYITLLTNPVQHERIMYRNGIAETTMLAGSVEVTATKYLDKLETQNIIK
jgi:hypothetical protein